MQRKLISLSIYYVQKGFDLDHLAFCSVSGSHMHLRPFAMSEDLLRMIIFTVVPPSLTRCIARESLKAVTGSECPVYVSAEIGFSVPG